MSSRVSVNDRVDTIRNPKRTKKEHVSLIDETVVKKSLNQFSHERLLIFFSTFRSDWVLVPDERHSYQLITNDGFHPRQNSPHRHRHLKLETWALFQITECLPKMENASVLPCSLLVPPCSCPLPLPSPVSLHQWSGDGC